MSFTTGSSYACRSHCASGLLSEDPQATSLGQGVGLAVEVLVPSGDPGVADERAGQDRGLGLKFDRDGLRSGWHRPHRTENGASRFLNTSPYWHRFLNNSNRLTKGARGTVQETFVS